MTWSFRGRTMLCGCVGCFPSGGFASSAVSRRRFLAGSAAAALGAGEFGTAMGQSASKPRRIDVHHHIVPPVQRKMNIERHGGSGGPDWSVQMSLDDMEQGGVACSITSISGPPWFGKVENDSRRLTRECNEYSAKLRSDYPNRFGMFAAIVPVDIEGSLKEIEYAFDTLKADGIALWTSFDGKYLGDPTFVPVLEELNRRRAVVYVHPTPAACCTNVVPGISPLVIEYATDTTRTVASLIFEKPQSAFKFPDIRWIWSHAGGTIPFLTGRFVRLAQDRKMKEEPIEVLQKYYYEIAQGNTPGQLAALMKLAPISQVMFGSDYPYRNAKEAVDGLAAFNFSGPDQFAIDTGNALTLFPNVRI